jgi:SAM-dependent methyltransferase
LAGFFVRNLKKERSRMTVSSHRQLSRVVDHLQQERRSHPEPVDPLRVADLWAVPGLPRSATYDPAWLICSGLGAPNVLWLTELLSQVMDLHRGMRVLDLGCGTAQSSIFLAREFAVVVWAADLWVDPTDNWRRIQEASESHRVIPLAVEAHELPFAEGFFDAIVSLDAFHYFGTDERYLPALLRFLRPGGQIGMVSPGNSADPDELPVGLPDLGWPQSDFFTFRSAEWWRRMWARSGEIEMETADMVTDGHQMWVRSLELEAAWFGDGDLAHGDRLMLASEPGQTLGFSRLVGRRPLSR